MIAVLERQRLVRDLYARAGEYEAAAVRAKDHGNAALSAEFRRQAASCERDADLLVLTLTAP